MPSGLFKRTEQHKKNISKALMGRTFSDSHKKNLSKVNTGKKLSVQHRERIKLGMIGKKRGLYSEESVKNITKGHWTKTKTELEKDEIKKRMAEKAMTIRHGTHGTFFSHKNNCEIIYRSSWELLAFQMLESNDKVLKYEYEKLWIQYIDGKGNKRWSVPDLLVHFINQKDCIIEVKPQFKITKNIYNTKEKLIAYEEYAKTNNLSFDVWTETKIFPNKNIISQ